jgi:hypothetical protein
MYILSNHQLCVRLWICRPLVLASLHHACKIQLLQMLWSLIGLNGMQEEDDDEGGDEDPEMEGELTSADYRKLQSLVDEQEKAVEAGELITALPALQSTSHIVKRNTAAQHEWYWVQERF